MMLGLLPPSSRVTLLRLLRAAITGMSWPTCIQKPDRTHYHSQIRWPKWKWGRQILQYIHQFNTKTITFLPTHNSRHAISIPLWFHVNAPSQMRDLCITYLCGACEGHLVHVHVFSNGSSRRRAVTGDDVDHARGKPSLQIELHS